ALAGARPGPSPAGPRAHAGAGSGRPGRSSPRWRTSPSPSHSRGTGEGRRVGTRLVAWAIPRRDAAWKCTSGLDIDARRHSMTNKRDGQPPSHMSPRMPKPRRGSSGHDPAPEGIPRKLTERIARAVEELVEPDEAHLAHELRSWAASLPGTVLIAEAPLRTAVRVAGEVR